MKTCAWGRVPGDSTDVDLGSLNGQAWNGKGGVRIPSSWGQPPSNRPHGHGAANPLLIYLSSIPPLSIESPWAWLGGRANSAKPGQPPSNRPNAHPSLSLSIYYIYYKSKSPWATAFGANAGNEGIAPIPSIPAGCSSAPNSTPLCSPQKPSPQAGFQNNLHPNC